MKLTIPLWMRIANRMGREDMAKFFYGQDHRL
jgi:hypothetical protein